MGIPLSHFHWEYCGNDKEIGVAFQLYVKSSNLYIFNFHQWVAAFPTWAETRFLNAKGSRRVYTEWSRKTSHKL